MAVLTHYVVPLVCFILFRHVFKCPTGALLLEGLKVYMPSSKPIIQQPSANTKKEKKQLSRRQLELKGSQSQQLICQQLTHSGLMHLYREPATMGGDLESVGVVLLVVALALVVHVTLGPLFGLRQDFLIMVMGLVLVGYAAWLLLRSEINPLQPTLPQLASKLHLPLLFVAGAAAAMWVLTVAGPQRWAAFNVAEAAGDFDELFASLIRQRRLKMGDPPPLNPFTLAVVVSAAAGVIAATLWTPMLSLARMYMLHSPVPSWGAQYLAPSPEAMRAMQLGLALPAAVTLLWVPPMTDGWGVPPAALAAAAPVLLAVTAASQLLALRLLAQLHLNGGLLEWHQLAHDGTQAAVKPKIVERRLTFVYITVCKVALQLLAPAAMLACLAGAYAASCGALTAWLPATPLVLRYVWPGAAAAAAEAAAAAGPSPSNLPFVSFLSAFLAWWTCAVSCCYLYPMLLVFRTGMHVSA